MENKEKKGLSTKIKENLFVVSNNILVNCFIGKWVYCLILIVELLQMYPLYLSLGLEKYLTYMDQFDLFLQIFKTGIGMRLAIEATTFATCIAMIIISGIFLILVISLWIINLYVEKEKNQSIRSGILGVFYKLSFFVFMISSILLYPIVLILLLDLFRCVSDNGKLVFHLERDIVCYQSLHLVTIIFTIISCIFFFVIIILFELLFADSSPHSGLPWACSSNSKIGFWKHLIKLIVCIIFNYDSTGVLMIVEYPLIIIIYIIYLYFLLRCPPFINPIVGKVTIFISGFGLGIIICMFFLNGILSNLTWGCILIMNLASALLGLIFIQIKNTIDNYYLTLPVDTQKDEDNLIYYFYQMFALLDEAKTSNKNSMLTLLCIYSFHQSNCLQQKCVCKTLCMNKNTFEKENNSEGSERSVNDEQNSESINKSQKIFKDHNIYIMKELIQYQLNEAIKRMPRSFNLRIISSFYISEFIGNEFKALFDLSFASEVLKSNLKDDSIMYRFRRKIENIFQNKLANSRDLIGINKFINFHDKHSKLREKVKECSSLVISFWEQLESQSFDFSKLYTIGSLIASCYLKVCKLYDKTIKIFPKNYILMGLKADLEKLIMNNEGSYRIIEGEILATKGEVRELIKTLDFDDPLESYSVSNTVVFHISGNPKKMGKILNVNNEVERKLKYKIRDLRGQNISTLLIDQIGLKHNQLIEKYINDGNKTIDLTKRPIIILNGLGYLQLYNMTVILTPNFESSLIFMCLLKSVESIQKFTQVQALNMPSNKIAFAVANLNGNIIGVSEECHNHFGIPSNIINKNSAEPITVTTSDIFPDIEDPISNSDLNMSFIEASLDITIIKDSISREILSIAESNLIEKIPNKLQINLMRTEKKLNLLDDTLYIFWFNEFGNRVSEKNSLKYNSTEVKEDNIQKEEEEEKFVYDIPDTASVSSVSSYLQDGLQKRIQNFKSGNNKNTKSDILNVIKRIIDIFMVLILATTIALCVLQVFHFKNNMTKIDSYFLIADRVSILSRSFLVVNLINLANQTFEQAPQLMEANYFELLNEIGKSSLKILDKTQIELSQSTAQNFADLQQTENISINSFEATSSLDYISKKLSLGQVITQYANQIQNYLSYTYQELRSNSLDKIRIFKELHQNYIESLQNATYQTNTNFFNQIILIDLSFIIPNYIISSIMACLIIIVFIVVRKQIPQMQQSAKEVILIYSEITHNELKDLQKNCLKYQKKYGFSEFNVHDEEIENNSRDFEDNLDLRKRKSFNENNKTKEGLAEKQNKNSKEDDDDESRKKSQEEEEANESKDIINQQEEAKNKVNEEIKKKKKLIRNTIKKSIFKFTIMVIGLIVFYLSFYIVVNIILNINDKNNIQNYTNLKQHFKREYNMMLSIIYALELLHNDKVTASSNNLYNFFLSEILSDNSYLIKLENNQIPEISSILNLLVSFDTQNFCNLLPNEFEIANYYYLDTNYSIRSSILKFCSSYSNQIMSKGYQNSRAYIYRNLDLIRQFPPNTYNWTSSPINDSITIQVLFLTIVGQSIPVRYIDLINNSLTLQYQIIIIISVIYMAFVFIAQILLRIILLSQNEEEVFKAKGMLRIIPEEYIARVGTMSEHKKLLDILNI